MSIETNLNQSPYFDDFNENKNFHRVLFRPGYAVQARELTQIQTILQNQIERFANRVVYDGKIISGCNFRTETVDYVKLRDKDANNRVLLLGDFFENGLIANSIVTGNTSGVQARLIDAKEGSEAAAPDYLSVFVKYINSGTSGESKQFTDGETLIFRRSSNNEFLVAADAIPTSATGLGTKASVGDGVVYHKGHFIRVDPQFTIVDKYSTTPNKKVGFETRELIVDSNQDSSLLDNASGATNFSAPGANRLKLTPILTSRPIAEANTTSFFPIAYIENGIVTQQVNDELAGVNQLVASRLYETHGNYAIEPFNIRVREHLKRDDNLGYYEDGNVNKLVAQVEPAIAYVGGQRVALQGTVTRDVDKATDYEVKDARIIGQTFGNYVIVNEVVGLWEFDSLSTVSLYDTAQRSISNKNYGIQGASGSVIGTARVRGFEYESGTKGTALGRFRIYLFDIQMNTGKSFGDVKSLYEVYSGFNSMADLVLENDIGVLKETGKNRLVFPFSQSGTKTLKDSTNSVDTQFVWRAQSNVNITVSGETTISPPTRPNGTNRLDTPTNRNVIILTRESASTIAHSGDIIEFTGNTITGSGTAFDTAYRVGDIITITDGVSNTVNERITEIESATSIKVANTVPYTRSGVTLAHKTTFPAGYMFDQRDATVTVVGTSYEIDLNRGTFASDFQGTVYYNVVRTNAEQTKKDVNKNKFVYINTGNNASSSTGPWPLGVSDAFKLVAVYKGSNTGTTTTDNDVTSDFELDTGMKDAFYDTAYLRKKSTSTLDVTNCGLLVKFNYFGRDRSTGIGFLSVDSYPINDANTADPIRITTQEIPIFVSPTTGVSYDLRDSIDFRPIKNVGTVDGGGDCVPSATAGSAPVNPTAGTEFDVDSTGTYLPAPDENFQCDVQFYLPRKDRVVLTKEGRVEIVKGVPSLTPKTPDEKGGSMTLGVLDIPVYPSLSPYTARNTNRQDYQVRLNLENNRRYTMKDLRAVEQRVKSLEYYSSLNALEASAKNKQLFGDTGIDRFKNGIFVDNFDGHNLADVNTIGYRASIDRNRTLLRPTFSRSDISFSKDIDFTSSNVVQIGNLAMLSHTEVSFLEQKFGSKLRNPVQEITFNWTGEVVLDPSMDNTPDITTLPDVQIDFSGMYDAIETLVNKGQDGVDWGVWTNTAPERRVGIDQSTRGRTTTTTQTFQTDQIREGIQTTVSPSSELISLGNYVENVAVRDFMRSRLINFTGLRMKPSTHVYPYFDNELVTGYCTPTNSSFANTGIEGANLVTDSTGTVYGVFRVPNDNNLKFRVGTRRFELKDIANTQTQSSLVTTSAHGDFTSIPLEITQRGASVNLVTPQISENRVTENRTVNRTVVSRFTEQDNRDGGNDGRGGSGDPIAQTFTVNLGNTTEGVFITKMDLFFGRKSSTYPISLQIREVENGFPTPTILPFASKTLQASEVNVSLSSADVATTFTFSSPVFLSNKKEYCFVVKPAGDNNEYALWTGELGGTDVDTSELIHKQPSGGVMLTSANDRTWSAIQSEDIKFKMYRANFTTSTGSVYIENDPLDFFSVDNFFSTFRNGEKIVSESVLTFSNNDSISVGTVLKSYAASVGTANAHFANGVVREIVTSGSGSVTVKVDNYGTFPTSGTSANALNVFTGANTWIGNTTAFSANTNNGFVKFVNPSKGQLQVENSSGGFANGWIRGQVSGATARVTSVNDVQLNTLVPKIPVISYANTSVSFGARVTNSGGTIASIFVPIDVGVENDFIDSEKKVYSKTNEDSLSAVTTDGTSSKKSLVIKGTLSTTDTFVSPMIDLSRANAIALGNIINNDATDEHKTVGDASVRYFSRPIELADGNDAEDLKVFVTAYKPSGTQMRVYARIHNPEDGESFNDKDFTPLTQITSANVFSDSVDTSDYREFEFGFSANTDGQGFLTTANSHARLNTSNNEVVTYRAGDGSIHATYKTFALKIVLTSTGTNVVPLVRDLRGIALQK